MKEDAIKFIDCCVKGTQQGLKELYSDILKDKNPVSYILLNIYDKLNEEYFSNEKKKDDITSECEKYLSEDESKYKYFIVSVVDCCITNMDWKELYAKDPQYIAETYSTFYMKTYKVILSEKEQGLLKNYLASILTFTIENIRKEYKNAAKPDLKILQSIALDLVQLEMGFQTLKKDVDHIKDTIGQNDPIVNTKNNAKYSLFVVNESNHLTLSEESKETLKEIYQMFVKNGRSYVEIEINLSDPEEIAKLLVKKDILDECGIEAANHDAKQLLLRKLKTFKPVFNTAVEYLLQDEMIDSIADRLGEFYIDKYKGTNLFFTDEDGIEYPYWIPFLWFDIIDEILKEIIECRYFYYSRSKDYTEIDCFVQNRRGKEIWDFRSFIQNQSDDVCKNLLENLKIPCWCGDYLDLPLQSLAFHVYPDFYYNIGRLKSNMTNESFEKINQYRGVFRLNHYYVRSN